jgi:hypothetical protein
LHTLKKESMTLDDTCAISFYLESMSDSMKRKQVRVYLDKEDQRRFEDLVASVSQLSESALMSLILHGALESLEQHGGRFSLPLHFAVVEDKEVPLIPSTRRS